MPSATLVVIYNHHYPSNYKRINLIYGERFTKIFHLIPFYTGDEANVIAVYENSIYFQGYIAQAFSRLAEEEADHFLFISDDMILNPIINEDSYSEIFGVDNKSNFISEITPLSERETHWQRISEALTWTIKKPGLEIVALLPTLEQATSIFNEQGLENHFVTPGGAFQRNISFSQLFKFRVVQLRRLPRRLYHVMRGNIDIWRENFKLGWKVRSRWNRKFRKGKINLQYPLVGAYSDLLLVNKHDLKQFSHYCGLFAASRLHVELAIPTALVLTSRNIRTENDISRSGRAYWGAEVEQLSMYNYSLNYLLKNFPDDNLYIHPIKLSKWS